MWSLIAAIVLVSGCILFGVFMIKEENKRRNEILDRIKARGAIVITIHSDGTVTSKDERK